MQDTEFGGTPPPMISLEDLDFTFPEALIATERAPASRVMLVEGGEPREFGRIQDLLPLFEAGDCLVVNDTRVLKRRVFSESGLEILFLDSKQDLKTWEVLCPSSRWKAGTEQILPGGVRLKILERGRPQVVAASDELTPTYFELHGELPLPPYIQKARGERHGRSKDLLQYQTAWAKHEGSLAAPTASLHFSTADLESLRERGVKTVSITLHVGLGTFLPVTVDRLEDHVMHAEAVEISNEAWQTISETKKQGGRIWAMGTTVTRSLESKAHGVLVDGKTELFIRPGFEFRIVDVLLTNFHQPRSTLLALVSAFAGLAMVKSCYAWAIEREFRLFSYGDLTVWIK